MRADSGDEGWWKHSVEASWSQSTDRGVAQCKTDGDDDISKEINKMETVKPPTKIK